MTFIQDRDWYGIMTCKLLHWKCGRSTKELTKVILQESDAWNLFVFCFENWRPLVVYIQIAQVCLLMNKIVWAGMINGALWEDYYKQLVICSTLKNTKQKLTMKGRGSAGFHFHVLALSLTFSFLYFSHQFMRSDIYNILGFGVSRVLLKHPEHC